MSLVTIKVWTHCCAWDGGYTLHLFFFLNSTVTLHCQRLLLDPVDAHCVFLNSRSYVRNSVRMPALSSKAGVHAQCQAHVVLVQIFSLSVWCMDIFFNVYGLLLASLWLSKLFSVAAVSIYETQPHNSLSVYLNPPLVLLQKIFSHATDNKVGFTKFERKFQVGILSLFNSFGDLQCHHSSSFCSSTIAFLRAWLVCCFMMIW